MELLGFLLIGIGIVGIIITIFWTKFIQFVPIIRFEKRKMKPAVPLVVIERLQKPL